MLVSAYMLKNLASNSASKPNTSESERAQSKTFSYKYIKMERLEKEDIDWKNPIMGHDGLSNGFKTIFKIESDLSALNSEDFLEAVQQLVLKLDGNQNFSLMYFSDKNYWTFLSGNVFVEKKVENDLKVDLHHDCCPFCKKNKNDFLKINNFHSDIVASIQDLYPCVKTHELIIPVGSKAHVTNLKDIMKDHSNISVLTDSLKIIDKLKEECPNFVIIINNGIDIRCKGQSIKHLHIHFRSKDKDLR